MERLANMRLILHKSSAQVSLCPLLALIKELSEKFPVEVDVIQRAQYQILFG